MTTSAALFNPSTTPGLAFSRTASTDTRLGVTGGNGAISGGLIRPGSIDQTTFLRMLQQQQQNRQAAGVGGKPVSMPIQSFQPAIPTLSSAQFAALVGAQNANAGLADGAAEAPAADPQAVAAAQQAQPAAQTIAAQAAAARAPALKLSGTAQRTAGAAASDQTASAPATGADEEAAPTFSRAAAPQLVATATAPGAGDEAPQIYRNNDQTAAASMTGSGDETSAEGETASTSDPDVVHLKSPPDKEQQTELRMRHKRWVVDETPGARQLFFGADGEFGWDDFLDVINPLQHIPIIAQIYRAVTGDEINGAANLLGAIPFGPLGGPGMIAAIADLAVKDVTGEDVAGNLEAMLFGKDGGSESGTTTAPADMAALDGSGSTTVEVASRTDGYPLSSASQLHEDCRG